MKNYIGFVIVFLAISLSCNQITGVSGAGAPQKTKFLIGFNLTDQTAVYTGGDDSAPKHLFVHKYPMPADGNISGLILQNDKDMQAEDFSLLILRPIQGGWKVSHRMDIHENDAFSITAETSTIMFEKALPVEKGDVFAHWQLADTGAIPFNSEGTSIEGLSAGKFGLSSKDVEEGQIISNDGLSGSRDYFINLIFESSDD
ncbi:MAG: hypothetical protein H6635_10875 [Anaerolineales bacterium]|nr:hypothetical protein [Anaerolineales bacterium]MCB9145866.1 hypothetical protein [Anaerolineales bacterium]